MKKRVLQLLVTVLTITLGAVPATYFCLLALLAMIAGGSLLLDGSIIGIFWIALGSAACYGTVSLWAIGFREITPVSKTGLLAGSIALIAAVAIANGPSGLASLLSWKQVLAAIGPLVVAGCWMLSFIVDIAKERRQSASR